MGKYIRDKMSKLKNYSEYESNSLERITELFLLEKRLLQDEKYEYITALRDYRNKIYGNLFYWYCKESYSKIPINKAYCILKNARLK